MSENQYKTALDNETIAIESVTKRDGTLAPFDSNRIYNAILKAGTSTNEFGEQEAWLLTGQVLKVLKHKFAESLPSIEQIQDIVEQVLISANYFATAKAYILYRDQRNRSRADKKVMVDVESSINEYLEKLDWRVNANANQGYSNGGLILNVSGKVTANYWLSHVYPAEVGEAHRNGDIHIHDLDMLAAYCAGWSLKNLLHEGFNGVPGKTEAGPAKHLSAAVGQMVNFMGTLQNEWAGAQAFSSVDTYLAPYIRADNLSYEQVEQAFQELIYNLNVPSRWGSQTPFTNFTFDWVCPEDLRDKHPIIAGVEQPFTYGDLKEEMHMINKAYITVMMKGDIKGRPFTFPIPTYNMTPDFPWEDDNTELLFEMTAKYGLPYFQNFINSVLKPGQIRSMCCRLQLDLRELLARGNGLFGSAEQTGSIGVITFNCARLGYVYKGDEAGLFARVDELMNIARTSLEIKRKVIQRLIDNGLFPFTKRYLGTLRNHFSTIGVNGINEMIRTLPTTSTTLPTSGVRLLPRSFLITSVPAWSKFRKKPAICTTLKPRRPKAPPTASPARTKSATRALSRPVLKKTRITPTLRNCLSALPTIRSKLWIYSLICRPNIPAAPFSTCIWASGFLRPKFAATLSAKF